MSNHLAFLVRGFALSAFILSSCLLRGETPAAPSPEERLARLEAALARIESRLNDTVSADELAPTLKEYSDLTQALGWDGKSPLPAVNPAGREKSLALGGFIPANDLSGKAPEPRLSGSYNTFLLRRARIGVTGAFAEKVSFKYAVDFGNNSIAAKTGISGQFTDAHMSWTKFPAAGWRTSVPIISMRNGRVSCATTATTATPPRSTPRLSSGLTVFAASSGATTSKSRSTTSLASRPRPRETAISSSPACSSFSSFYPS